MDWRASSIQNLIEDDMDRYQVWDLLRAHYAEIKVLYASLCSVELNLAQSRQSSEEGVSLVFGVTLNEYTHMLLQHHILGGGSSERGADQVTLVEADSQFLLAAVPPPDSHTWGPSTHKAARLLSRHGFFELLVRLALLRFRRDDILPVDEEDDDDSRPKPKAKSASHALDLLLNRHIMYPHPPMKYIFNCVQWRADILHSEEVEGVLRKHMKSVITPTFLFFSQECPPRRGHYMKVEGWFDLLDALKVLPCRGEHATRNTWDRCWIWQISAMSHIDELKGNDHLLLSSLEFLEALARLVALLMARSVNITTEEAEKLEYGLAYCAPSYAFCRDTSQVVDKAGFSNLLDKFLSEDLTNINTTAGLGSRGSR